MSPPPCLLPQASVDLPVELIEEILSVSPAKSVLRFKSVCKQWHAIISDPRFSRIHRIRRSKLSKNQNMCFVRRMRKERPNVRSLSLMRLDDGKLRKVSELDHQPAVTDYHRYYTPLCSCNVAFLLIIDDSDYMLWNPSIRKSTMIRDPCRDRYPSKYNFYHDETSDDYKIVFVYDYEKYTVYSCKNRSWGEMLYYASFVDGCLYMSSNREIVFFDFRDGKLDRFPQPNYDHDHVEEKGFQKVHAISGRMCLTLYNKSRYGKHRFEFWVMERNANLEHIWRKLISMEQENTRLFRSLWLSNEDNNVVIGVIENESNLSIYNCVEKRFQKIEFDWKDRYEPELLQYQENLYMPAA